ncbi:hypothetical protein [Pectobacterium phage PcCB7V]|nr:hypothetical protein [Pectobacterium phage PcCB7V]
MKKEYTVIFQDFQDGNTYVAWVEAVGPQHAFEVAALDHHVNSLLEDSSTFEIEDYKEIATFFGKHENLA